MPSGRYAMSAAGGYTTVVVITALGPILAIIFPIVLETVNIINSTHALMSVLQATIHA